MRTLGRFATRLAVERLEERSLLAGVVNVELLDGELWITGDDENNGIQVLIDPSEPGRVYVGPSLSPGVVILPTDGGMHDGPVDLSPLSTTVQGGERFSDRFVVFDGVTGGIHATMGDGNDIVYLHYGRPSAYPAGREGSGPPVNSVSIDLGAGNDFFLLGHAIPSLAITWVWPLQLRNEAHPLTIAGDLEIATGTGNDYLALLATIGGEKVLTADSDHLELFQSDHLTDEIYRALNVTPWLHEVNRTPAVDPQPDHQAIGQPISLPDTAISQPPSQRTASPSPVSSCDAAHSTARSAAPTLPPINWIGPRELDELFPVPEGESEASPQLVSPLTADAYFYALAAEDFSAQQRKRR